jgi:hypothetical protein
MKSILKGPDGMTVKLDTDEIYVSDPGMGTPVLVCLGNGETASWNCATNEAETLDGTRFSTGLSTDQKSWLDRLTPQIDEWCRSKGARQ